MTAIIPDSHKHLLGAPYVVTLVTLMPDGYPQATAVWCKSDENGIYILTRNILRKAKNIMANPKVTVLSIDPENPQRYIEVRGEATLSRDGANDLLKEVATSYGRPDFPIEQGAEYRVIITVRPQKIITRG